MDLAPVVTGMSPIEGVPGTKVTIRGENFGTKPEDLIGLIICGLDCFMSAEWKSSQKIIARSGTGMGKGDIIVVTLLGGRGTSTVQFKGCQETIGLLKESAVWVDETVFLKKMVYGRKRPMSPSASAHEDPLGLSIEGNENRIMDDALCEMFPVLSGDLTASNFSSEWFLLENHLMTSYGDLRAGLSCLRRKVESYKEGQISFLKANVGSVLEQLDTLQELKCTFESDIQQHGRESTNILEKAIIECKKEANQLFDDVLLRKDRADGTRNALNVLHRFRFLLYLPVNIERHIQKGDYDVVINDYARAKSLFGDTKVSLFKKFYEEVEKRISDLRDVLSEELIKMPSSLEHQKKIIRNLHHLETTGDPAWECLCALHNYIIQQLVTDRDNYLNRELTEHDLGGSQMGIPGGNSRHSTPAAKYNKIMSSTLGEWQATAPMRILLTEDLCTILSSNFPDLWKLSQAYFGQELGPVVADFARQKECKDMIFELLHIFGGVIRGSIMPHSLDPHGLNYRKYHIWPETSMEELSPWLPQVVRHVRGCYSTLLTLDLPGDALDIIKDLIFDLRVHCLTSLFQQTVEHVSGLYSQENWRLEVDDFEGGCTCLPHICEDVIIECAKLVQDTVLEVTVHEPCLLEHPSVRRDISTLIHNMIVAFAQTLEKLSLCDPDDASNHISHHINRMSDKNDSENLPGVEAQLLITLSNCAFMKKIVLPRLTESLIRFGYPRQEVEFAIKQASKTYTELHERLFEAYLEERVDPIIGMIERSMYLGHFDWGRVQHKPDDVRNYIKEILLNIVQVHAEVIGVWPELISAFVGRVVDGVGEEMARLTNCVRNWSEYGALQAHIDLASLTDALSNYMSSSAKASFEEALGSLPPIGKDNQRVKEEVLAHFHKKTSFLLDCFRDISSLPKSSELISVI